MSKWYSFSIEGNFYTRKTINQIAWIIFIEGLFIKKREKKPHIEVPASLFVSDYRGNYIRPLNDEEHQRLNTRLDNLWQAYKKSKNALTKQ